MAATLLLGGGFLSPVFGQTYIAPSGDVSYIFQTSGTQFVSTSPDHSSPTALSPFTTIDVNLAGLQFDNGLTLSQAIQVGPGSATVALGSGNLITTLGGDITGSSSLVLGYTDTSGTFILSGDNSGYSGTLSIANLTTVQAGSANALSPASYTVDGTLDLNGQDSSITSLSGSGTVESSSGPATLTINSSSTSAGTFTGIIQDGGAGALSLVKSGSGYQSLDGTFSAMNTYSGSTTVNAGILSVDLLADSGAASSIGTGGQINLGSSGQMGDLQVSNVLTTNNESNRSIMLAAGGTGAIEVVGNGDANIPNGELLGALVTWNGNITGDGTLLKLGIGNLDLRGTNTYTGGTVVDSGLLRFDTAASVPATGMITVNSGGAVGTGYAIDQAFLNQINPTSTGVVALGSDSNGNLDFTNFSHAALGAMGHLIFSGSLTPNNTAGYQLGGGGVNNISIQLNGANSVLFIAYANTITGNHNVTVSPHGTAGAGVVFDDTQNFTGTLTVAGGINAEAISSGNFPGNGNNYVSGLQPAWMANASLVLAGGSDGNLPNLSGVILNPLGDLEIVATAIAVNNLPSSVPITFNGGTLVYVNDDSNVNFSDTFGAINLVGGGSEVFSQGAQSGKTSTLTFAGINRALGTTVTFAGSGLGASTRNEIVITDTSDLSTTLATPWAFVGGGTLFGNGDLPTDFAIISNTGTNGSIQAANGAVVTADSTLAGGDYTIQGTTTFNLTDDRTANTIRVTSASDETIALNGHTLAVNELMNVGQNGNQGSILTMGSTVGDGNLTAVAGSNELILNPAQDYQNGASNIVVNSNITDNDTAVTLVKTGVGDLMLAGSNSFSGGAVVDGEGSLIIAAAGAFGSGPITLNSGAVQLANGIAANTVITNDWAVNADAAIVDADNVSGLALTGSISINGVNTTLYWVGGTDQSRFIDGAISGTGNLALQGDFTAITLGGSSTNTYSGLTSIAGSGDGNTQTIVSLEKTDGATAISGNILLGVNSNAVYSQPTLETPQQEILVLNQGGVANWSSNNIAATSVITFQGGNGNDAGVFQLNGNNQTLGGIQSATNGDGIIENNSNTSGASTLTVQVATGTSYVYSGLLLDHDPGNNNAGKLTLVKAGSGNLTLLNTSSYSGGTTINGGTLYANNFGGGGSATGSGTISVAHGATLAGTGFLNNTSGAANLINGNVAVGQDFAGDSNTFEILTMQASVGTIFSGANLTFNLSTTTLGQGNELAVGSTPNVLFNGANTLTLDMQGAGVVPDDTQYVLLTSTVTGTNVGGSVFGGTGLTLTGTMLSGLTLDFVNTTGTNYAGTLVLLNNSLGGYNVDLDIAIVAVPEPGTWVLMLGGLMLLLICHRMRRSRHRL